MSDLVIRHPTVSRRHARLIKTPKGYEVVDEGSRNGTRLNGRRLPPGVPFALCDGDEIAFAQAAYFCHIRPMGDP